MTADDERDLSRDAESPQGEWGGPRDAGGASTGAHAFDPSAEPVREPTEETAHAAVPGDAAAAGAPPAGQDDTGMTVIADTDAYASTEPLSASESTPPVEPRQDTEDTPDVLERPSADLPPPVVDVERDDTDRTQDTDRAAATHRSSDPAGAEVATDEPAEVQGSGREHPVVDEAGGEAPVTVTENENPEWAADESAHLASVEARAQDLAADREELQEHETSAPSGVVGGTGGTTDQTSADPATSSRRTSGFDEIRDGGYGVGSAAVLDDGAMPMDHPVQGHRDSMTFVAPGDPGYDEHEPDVWFYDEGAAERAGFRRSRD